MIRCDRASPRLAAGRAGKDTDPQHRPGGAMHPARGRPVTARRAGGPGRGGAVGLRGPGAGQDRATDPLRGPSLLHDIWKGAA